jgi:hypothetical protein
MLGLFGICHGKSACLAMATWQGTIQTNPLCGNYCFNFKLPISVEEGLST